MPAKRKPKRKSASDSIERRRITELRPNIDPSDLENVLRDVIETLGTRERKVTDKKGTSTRCACALIVPPITKIHGAVITLVDLEGKKDSYAGKTPRRPK